ncbi:GNAT family N-acetyltransferase [Micromonospora sp. NPDC048835]|uniref:GNAT family N-acetyltransferase n=1 Tax=Micromonospora sp. NPDC048835 TaxID=3155147 RepID=UPI00340322EE
MFQPTFPIRTARLTLRPVTIDDLDDVYAYQRRPDVVRWMLGAEPRTRAQSRASVLAMAGEDAWRAEGDCLTVAAVTDAGVIGIVELVWRSRLERTAEQRLGPADGATGHAAGGPPCRELPVQRGVGRPTRLRGAGARVADRDPHAAVMIVQHGDVRVVSTPQAWRPSHSR